MNGTEALTREAIKDIYGAAVKAGLQRDTLLAVLDPSVRAILERDALAGGQIFVDLHHLNRMGRLLDGTVPIRAWLEAAELLTGPRREAKVFQRALADLKERSAMLETSTGELSAVDAPRSCVDVPATDPPPAVLTPSPSPAACTPRSAGVGPSSPPAHRPGSSAASPTLAPPRAAPDTPLPPPPPSFASAPSFTPPPSFTAPPALLVSPGAASEPTVPPAPPTLASPGIHDEQDDDGSPPSLDAASVPPGFLMFALDPEHWMPYLCWAGVETATFVVLAHLINAPAVLDDILIHLSALQVTLTEVGALSLLVLGSMAATRIRLVPRTRQALHASLALFAGFLLSLLFIEARGYSHMLWTGDLWRSMETRLDSYSFMLRSGLVWPLGFVLGAAWFAGVGYLDRGKTAKLPGRAAPFW